jgi:hypothetical protein
MIHSIAVGAEPLVTKPVARQLVMKPTEKLGVKRARVEVREVAMQPRVVSVALLVQH